MLDQMKERIAELEACLQEIRSIHIEPSDTAYDAMKKVGDFLDSAQPRFLLAERSSNAFANGYAEGYAKGREDGVYSGVQYGLMAAKQCYDACKLIDSLDPHNDSTTAWNVAFNMVHDAVIAAENKEVEK